MERGLPTIVFSDDDLEGFGDILIHVVSVGALGDL